MRTVSLPSSSSSAMERFSSQSQETPEHEPWKAFVEDDYLYPPDSSAFGSSPTPMLHLPMPDAPFPITSGMKTFEDVITETQCITYRLPSMLENTPLKVSLSPQDMTLLASACHFAAQYSAIAKPDLQSLGDMLMTLRYLPVAQRPANARSLDLQWVGTDKTFTLKPKMFTEDRRP